MLSPYLQMVDNSILAGRERESEDLSLMALSQMVQHQLNQGEQVYYQNKEE